MILGIISLAGSSAPTTQVQGDGYYGGVVYYYPAPQVVYYRPYTPTYYARTAYYASPGPYYSYYAPCVYDVRPTTREESYSYQQSNRSGYSPRQPSAGKPTTTATVGAYDNQFSPQTINVQPGTTVRWVNYGRHSHTVTANNDSWDSGDIKPGASYSATFKQPGTYYYYCRHHTQDKMQGTIVVGASGARGDGVSSSSSSSGY
jgi:plastocyanin